MSETTSNADHWQVCPTGELSRAVRGIKARRRDNAIAKVVGATGALVILLLTVGLVAQQLHRPAGPNFGNIACSEVRENLPDYMASKLDKQLASQIRTHLAECPECGPMYQKMMSQMNTAQQACDGHRSCLCPTCFQRSAVAILDRHEQ